MTYHPKILVDTGLLVAFYDSADSHHHRVVKFFTGCRSRLVTTEGCVTEVMWLLAADWRVQNEFLAHLANRVYECESLSNQDFIRIAELNAKTAIALPSHLKRDRLLRSPRS